MREITFAQAINEALREEMKRDDKVYFVGEDIGLYHQGRGPCGVSTGLLAEFGENRVIETPISELEIVGSSVGTAMFGMRPVVEIMHAEFLPTCFEHLVYGGSKGAVILNGKPFPMVVRCPFGGEKQGQLIQNENVEAWFNHTPGLKVVAPTSPYHAKGMMKAAIRDDYPVLFFEHRSLYKKLGEVPDGDYVHPLGKAEIRRNGKDLSVIAMGNMVRRAMEAAETLSSQGINIEVVDLLSISPLDQETILESVKKTGRAVIVHEAAKTGGIGGEIAAVIAENAFKYLKAPILRVAGPDVHTNFPRRTEDVIAGVQQVMNYR